MTGAFDWGKDRDSGSSKGGKLPKHIERMNNPTEVAEVKQTPKDEGGLPWGGSPARNKDAYMSGLPKDKGSMISKLGERGSKGKGVSSLPGKGKAMQGHKMPIKSKAASHVGKIKSK